MCARECMCIMCMHMHSSYANVWFQSIIVYILIVQVYNLHMLCLFRKMLVQSNHEYLQHGMTTLTVTVRMLQRDWEDVVVSRQLCNADQKVDLVSFTRMMRHAVRTYQMHQLNVTMQEAKEVDTWVSSP
jgi:hypothetical protein